MKETSLKKGTIFLFISQIFSILTAYLLNFYLVRLVSPKEYGDYSIIVYILSLIALILSSTIPQASSKLVSEHGIDLRKIISESFRLQSILVVLITIVYTALIPQIGFILNDSSLKEYMYSSLVMIPVYGYYILFSRIENGKGNYLSQSLMDGLVNFAKLSLIFIIFLLFGKNTNNAIIGFSISPIISMVLGFILIKPILKKENEYTKDFLLFSIPFFLFSVLTNFSIKSGLFIIKYFNFSGDSVGYFAAYSTLSQILGFFPTALGLALFPKVSKTYSYRHLDGLKKVLNKSIILVFLITITPSLFLIIFKEKIVSFLFSVQYLEEISIFNSLIIGAAFFFIYNFLLTILSGIKKQNFSMIISIVTFLLTLVSSIILVPKFGMIGAPYSIITSSALGIVISIIYLYNFVLKEGLTND
ncbi:MAG: hypothetical protein AUK08_01670 [Candidatus Pacebacteria bacterium CG2_30_36_39]|nr:MAG: hypothetical protein AUK08_01670 [Candidatus Pacebacteria bacterium CG2_30_36_39]